MEIVKFQQAQLINSDLDMYYAPTDTPALCRTSSLVEELGQIEYVFSDKTGTLTCNVMEFKCCSIAGVAYAEIVEDSKRDDDDPKGGGGWRSFAEMKGILDGDAPSANPFVDVGSTQGGRELEVLREFLTLLSVCHTVIPEVKDDKITYQASSPDEAALVQGADQLGYRYHVCHFSLKIVPQLKLCIDEEAQVCVCTDPRQEPRVPDFERMRVQFHTETHVYNRAITQWQDQAVQQRR